MSENKQEIKEFIDYLAKNDIILSYWNPHENELLPILYDENSLVKNYAENKPAISGDVRRAE